MIDLLQQYIIKFGIEITLNKCIFEKELYISDSRINDLCKIAFDELGYNIKKFKFDNTIDYYYLLYQLLLLTNKNYRILKNHDYILQLCITKNKYRLINFVLHSRNYFDSILMLLLGINNLINNYEIIDSQLLVKYLRKLKIEYNIDYIDEIKPKIPWVIFSKINNTI